GLHFDEAQGLFFQQPLFVVGLLGLGPLFRRDWRLGVLLAAVYASIVVPNAMHINWYGGASFVGRFVWPAALLWVFPLAYAVDASLLRQRTWLAIFALAIAWQLVLATQWLPRNRLLVWIANVPSWAPAGVYGRLLDARTWVRLP